MHQPYPIRRIDSHDLHPRSMTESTLFTKIIEGDIPSFMITRSDDWVAFLDVFPRRPGHTLVVPVEPARRLSELSPTSLSHLLEGVVQTQAILSLHFQTQDFLVGVHDGPLAGQEVPHVHIHVIPRTEDDGGLSMMACWPDSQPIGGEPDFESLSKLAALLKD